MGPHLQTVESEMQWGQVNTVIMSYSKELQYIVLHSILEIPLSSIKDTCYLWGKNSKNLELLDILACNGALGIKPFWRILKKKGYYLN